MERHGDSHEVGNVLVDVVVEEVADCMGVDEFHVCIGARTGFQAKTMKGAMFSFCRKEKLSTQLDFLQ